MAPSGCIHDDEAVGAWTDALASIRHGRHQGGATLREPDDANLDGIGLLFKGQSALWFGCGRHSVAILKLIRPDLLGAHARVEVHVQGAHRSVVPCRCRGELGNDLRAVGQKPRLFSALQLRLRDREPGVDRIFGPPDARRLAHAQSDRPGLPLPRPDAGLEESDSRDERGNGGSEKRETFHSSIRMRWFSLSLT